MNFQYVFTHAHKVLALFVFPLSRNTLHKRMFCGMFQQELLKGFDFIHAVG